MYSHGYANLIANMAAKLLVRDFLDAQNSGKIVLGHSAVSATIRPICTMNEPERFYHTHILGRPGSGKSTLMKSLFLQDVYAGRGCCFIDPHGDDAEDILNYVPGARLKDVVYIDPSDANMVCSINPLYNIPPTLHSVTVSNLIETLRSIWPHSWGPRMEDVLRNSLFALIEQPAHPGVSLASIPRLLQDVQYRKAILRHVNNNQVRNYFLYDYGRLNERLRQETISPVMNKIRAFLSDPIARDMFSLATPTVDLGRAMKKGSIIIANLAQGKIGSSNALLLGSFIISSLRFSAQARAFEPAEERDPFFVYIDELQNFVTEDLVRGFAEVRKYKLSYTVAHQHRTQLAPALFDAIKETVGTMVAFSLGIEDAEYYAPIFDPVSPTRLSGQATGRAYMRRASHPGAATELEVAQCPFKVTNNAQKALRISQEHFYIPRAVAHEKIKRSERRYGEKYPRRFHR